MRRIAADATRSSAIESSKEEHISMERIDISARAGGEGEDDLEDSISMLEASRRLWQELLQGGIISEDFLHEVGLPPTSKANPPASKKFVEELEEFWYDNEEDCEGENCPVCVMDAEPDAKFIELPCSHIFHTDCIQPWLRQCNTCPVCRHELPTDDKRYEEERKHKMREADRKKDLETLHASMYM